MKIQSHLYGDIQQFIRERIKEQRTLWKKTAYSKSFLSVLIQMIRAILYPGAQLFTTAGGKEQAAQILQEKIRDICSKIPAFEREIDWRRGQTQIGKDSCKIVFKNKSTIENVAARESSRGLRKHGGVIEECVGVDQNMLQQIIIPRFWGFAA